MAATKRYEGGTCSECTQPMCSDIEEVGNERVSPRYRKDGPTCGTSGCTLDLKRRLAKDFTTYFD